MKQQHLSKVQQAATCVSIKNCPMSYKIGGVVALGGLFICGLMVGTIIKAPSRQHLKHIGMTESQCASIADSIINASRGSGCSGDTCADRLKELNRVYSENCKGMPVAEKPKPEPKQPSEPVAALPDEPCAAIEVLVSRGLLPDDDINSSTDYNAHLIQAELYNRMAKNGCPENSEQYAAKARYHTQIAKGLNPYGYEDSMGPENAPTCEKIERVLLTQLDPQPYNDVYAYLQNAEIYATLAERGCAEHAADHKAQAVQMIDIATALRPEKDMRDQDIESIVETYSKMNMKAKATEFLNKVQKLADPAIDFIYQLQQIINE